MGDYCRYVDNFLVVSYYRGTKTPKHMGSLDRVCVPHKNILISRTCCLFDFGVCRRAHVLCKVFLWYSKNIGKMRLFGLVTTAWIGSVSTNVSAFRASCKGRNARLASSSSSSPSRLPPITNYHLPSSSRLGAHPLDRLDAHFKTSNAAPAADPVDFIRSEISANDVSLCLLNSQ